MLHDIAVRADAGRPFRFELNVEQLRTLHTMERFWPDPQGTATVLEAGACRRMGAGGFDGPRNVQASSSGRPCRSSTASTDLLADFIIVASVSGPAPVPSSKPL